MPVANSRLEVMQVCKLLQCVRERHHIQVEKLVTNGVPHLINYTEPEEGDSALIIAAVANDEEMIKFLLELGAHPDVVDLQGRTALMRAAEFGHVESFEALAKSGANLKTTDLKGRGKELRDQNITFINELETQLFTYRYMYKLEIGIRAKRSKILVLVLYQNTCIAGSIKRVILFL